MTYSGCFQKSMSCIKISSPAKNVFHKMTGVFPLFLQKVQVREAPALGGVWWGWARRGGWFNLGLFFLSQELLRGVSSGQSRVPPPCRAVSLSRELCLPPAFQKDVGMG